jgi:Ca-activated chloride channel homolog
MHAHQRSCVLLSCLLLCATPFVIAQQSTSNQSPAAADAAKTTVTVTVTGRDHRPVSGLKTEDFALYEDGQRLSISSVGPAEPACVAIVVDESSSMRGKLAAIASAMGDFVRAGNPGNRILPIAFNDETAIEENFTADPALVEKSLMQEEPRGGTALYNAVMGTADYLARSKECNKRVLVVLSDGEDTEGRKTLEAALAFLQCAGNPLIYAIGLPHPDRAISSHGRHALEEMAKRSGGAAFFVESFNDLHKAALKVADELKNQYAVTYVATQTTRAGGPDIKVDAHASGQKNMSVRTNVAGTVDLSVEESAYVAAVRNCAYRSLVDESRKPVAGGQH